MQTSLSPSLVKQLVADHPVVPQDNISEFLDRVWARLPASELYEPDEFLKIMGPIFQPATYDPSCSSTRKAACLRLKSRTPMRRCTANSSSPARTRTSRRAATSLKGIHSLVRRDQTEEAALMAQLAEMHFQPRSTRLWFMEPEEAIAFLLDSYPSWWRTGACTAKRPSPATKCACRSRSFPPRWRATKRKNGSP